MMFSKRCLYWHLLAVTLLALPGAFGQTGLEAGINRPGGDYSRFALQRADPRECQNACRLDSRCRAFTFVRPGVQGPDAQCWLKSVASRPVRDPNCVSGMQDLAHGWNYPGGDYTSFFLQRPVATDCQAACWSDGRCRAFTYVAPGVQGPNAVCWLKAAVSQPVQNSACISGVKPTASQRY